MSIATNNVACDFGIEYECAVLVSRHCGVFTIKDNSIAANDAARGCGIGYGHAVAIGGDRCASTN